MSQKPDIHLFTAATPNGRKPLIFLEEAGIDYDVTLIDLGKNEQKEDWYVKLNPNGRIPTIVDRGNDDFAVFESGAILWYLAEKYGQFLPEGQKARSEALQWLMFQMAGIGPMMGQASHFQGLARNGHRDDYAIERYVNESRRLLEILDKQLEGRDYILGEHYSIVDMATFPWVRAHSFAKIGIDGLDNLKAWLDRIEARPAVQRAFEPPKPSLGKVHKGNEKAAETAHTARVR